MNKADEDLIKKHNAYVEWRKKQKQPIERVAKFLLWCKKPFTLKELMKHVNSPNENIYWLLQQHLKNNPKVGCVKLGNKNLYFKKGSKAERIAKDKAILYRKAHIFYLLDEVKKLTQEVSELAKGSHKESER